MNAKTLVYVRQWLIMVFAQTPLEIIHVNVSLDLGLMQQQYNVKVSKIKSYNIYVELVTLVFAKVFEYAVFYSVGAQKTCFTKYVLQQRLLL